MQLGCSTCVHGLKPVDRLEISPANDPLQSTSSPFQQLHSHPNPTLRFPVQLRMKTATLQAADYKFHTVKLNQRFRGRESELRKTGRRSCLLFGWTALQERTSIQKKCEETFLAEKRKDPLGQIGITGCIDFHCHGRH